MNYSVKQYYHTKFFTDQGTEEEVITLATSREEAIQYFQENNEGCTIISTDEYRFKNELPDSVLDWF